MKQDGFTLIEMLLVLSISFIILGISVLPAGNLMTHLLEKQSLDQLEIDIMYLQAEAITTNQESILLLNGNNDTYSGKSSKLALSRKLTPTLHFQEKSEQSFRFSPPFGNISRFKTIIIQGQNKKYALIFQIGKGRFRIDEI
ncbi:prepilin-type N-terminal cleavage/methylation domain-containing protein [Listeria sp. FSL L7-1582]|uniref:competence type IV pilus minor pilin ComGD n=1 Tax=Listeria portnoyi TaxID=2713504 RepID=UPI00164CF748|nr:competence type IV pilus minor pilin ComGD [Listeria portnoyi]MBC6308169.1 prepilin-type N-terminal cleavage/methylation domain-containing protein [Listeria portnoyi]